MRAISPSTIESWLVCPRRPHWDKVHGIPREQHASAARGEHFHGTMASYLFNGRLDTTTSEGAAIARTLHLLPPPGKASVERRFTVWLDGALFRGVKDVEYGTLVIDHKTTSSVDWIKTPDLLRTDPQAVIYAAETLSRGAPHVDLLWNYYIGPKFTPHKEPVRLRVLPNEIGPALRRCSDIARTIDAQLASRVDARTLPYNPHGCSAFGGCSYISLCNIPAHERYMAIMTMSHEDWMKSLAAQTAAANGQQQPLPLQQPPAQQPQQQAPWQPPQPTIAPEPPGPAPSPPWSQAPQQPQPQPQLPPQQWAPPQSPPVQYLPPGSSALAQWAPPPVQAPPAQPIAAPPAQDEPEAVKRGRRSKEQAAREDGFLLLIDCLPMKHPKQAGCDTYIQRHQRIAGALAQGGPALYAQALASDLETNPQILPLAVDSKTPEAQIAINTLCARAHTIIRGTT